jgi:hypothetical protein
MSDLILPHLLFLRAMHKSRQSSAVAFAKAPIERPVNPAKTRLSTIMGKAAVALELTVILQRSYRPKREYRSIMLVQECRRILRKLYVIKRMGNQWPPELRRPRPVLMDA